MAYRKFARRSYRRRFRRRARRGFSRRVRRIAFSIAEKKYSEFWFAVGGGVTSFVPSYSGMPTDKPLAPYDTLPQEFVFGSLLMNILQGFTQNLRVGNKIFLEYIQLSINVIFSAADDNSETVNGCLCRYVVTRTKGKSENGTVNPFTSGPFHSVHGLKNPAYMTTKRTIIDRQVRMAYPNGGSTTLQGGTGVPVIQHFIPVKKMITYGGVLGPSAIMTSPSNMMDNDYQFGACCQMDNQCRMLVAARVCFRDA